MGNELSTSTPPSLTSQHPCQTLLDRRPTSLAECIDDEGLKAFEFLRYRQCQRRSDESDSSLSQCMDSVLPPEAKPPKKRTKKGSVFDYLDEKGQLVHSSPTLTQWYKMYVTNDPTKLTGKQHNQQENKFRSRFRLPYQNYKDLVKLVKAATDIFGRWLNPSSSSPIELLVLGALRYLGRGWTFDDIEEQTGISKEVHRVFFHRFIYFGKTKLYDEFVILPNNNNKDAAIHQHEYSLAGLNGAIGSTDAVHIVLEKVRYKNRNLHLGYKLAHTARTYNVTVNHRRRILSTTSGHPARWNDKTLVLFDKFIRGVHEGVILTLNCWRELKMVTLSQ
jgi:hypothetical protein